MSKLITYSKGICKNIPKVYYNNFMHIYDRLTPSYVVLGGTMCTVYSMIKTDEYLNKNYNRNLHICVRNTSLILCGFIGAASGFMLGVTWPISLPLLLGSYGVKHPSLSSIYNNIKNAKV